MDKMIKDVYKYFKDMDNYCIIRVDKTFPNYNKGDDIDILVKSKEIFFNNVLMILDNYNLKKNNIKLPNRYPLPWKYYKDNEKYNIFTFKEEKSCAIDICDKNNNIILRFDIVEDIYNNKNLKEVVLKNKIKKKCMDGNSYYICNKMDDLSIRYLEYKKFVGTWREQDKKKHLLYIKNTDTPIDEVILYLQKI